MKLGKPEIFNFNAPKKLIWKVIALITFAVMFIPMMYSLFYLSAFWNPYGNLKNVPVAFVNLDEPYMRDGKSYTYGKDLETNIKKNNSFKWEFVGYNKAKKGVDGASYYAMIVIPKNFSKDLADSTNGNFQKPQIIYRANKGRNFIFSLLSEKGAESIQNKVASNISKETSKVLVDKLYEVKNSLKDASDAQDKIQDGTQKLTDGGEKLSTNLGDAYTGSQELKTGLDTAANGSLTLENGLFKLLNGSDALSNGLLTASDGSNKLNSGLNELADGQKRIVGGTKDLNNGLKTFKSQLSSGGSSDMQQLVKGASDVDDNMKQLQQSLSSNSNSFKSQMDGAAKGINQIADLNESADELLSEATTDLSNGNIEKAKREIAKAKGFTALIKSQNIKTNIANNLQASDNTIGNIADNVTAIRTNGTAPVAAGTVAAANKITQTMTTANQGLDTAISGANDLETGSTQVYNGLLAAVSGNSNISSGLSQLYTGSTALNGGLNTAYNGSNSLTSGLNTAASSTETLASGLSQLSDGSKTLASNLGTLNDGTTKLKNGLNDGYDKINRNLKFSANDLSKFVSDPVKLSDQSINNVEGYGEGLAPYFISLSLWLGSLFINLILTLISMFKLTDNKILNTLRCKYAIGIGLVIVQAIVLAFSLHVGLGLNAVKIPYLYLCNIFISVTFFSVMFGLTEIVGIASTPIVFILLILQLSACGGTFPIESSPLFYKNVSTFIPMTYTVAIVRMIIDGINSSELIRNILSLLKFIVTFLACGSIVQVIKNKVVPKIASKINAEDAA